MLPSETWVIAVHEALSGLRGVVLAQLVPAGDRYELVLTTRTSPPDRELVESVRGVLSLLVGRKDSPLAAPEGSATWHFYPPLGDRERKLFTGLDWSHAVVVHEWVD